MEVVSSRKQKYLVVNGDDLGYSQSRDRGIFEIFQEHGSISSASILANGVFSKKAAEQSKKIGLPVGLHFNISEGKPLSRPAEIPSLVNTRGHFLGKHGFRQMIEKQGVKENQVKIELRAQLEWFKKHFGALPVHVDGHHHIHVMPAISEAFCKVLLEKEIRWTRMPIENNIEKCRWIDDRRRIFYESVVTDAKETLLTFVKHGINFPGSFCGMSCMGKDMSKTRITKLLHDCYRDSSNSMTCELMTHPGYGRHGDGGCGEGQDLFSMSSDRDHEMNVLKNPEMKLFYKRQNINIVSYHDLDKLL